MNERAKELIEEVGNDLFEEYEGVPYTSHILQELTRRYCNEMTEQDRLAISMVFGGEARI